LLASIQETLESTWVTAVNEFTWSGVDERLEGCSECTDAILAVLGGCCAEIANADATEVGTVDFTLAEGAALCLWKGVGRWVREEGLLGAVSVQVVLVLIVAVGERLATLTMFFINIPVQSGYRKQKAKQLLLRAR
jgi:hypothetical protein